MIQIRNKEHFREAMKVARSLGGNSKKTFINSLRTLNRIKRNSYPDYILEIGADFVKHSFVWIFFTLNAEGQLDKRGMNGGMILHGFEETFSVEINPKSYPHWSIHT